jgi:hypothetical protein
MAVSFSLQVLQGIFVMRNAYPKDVPGLCVEHFSRFKV